LNKNITLHACRLCTSSRIRVDPASPRQDVHLVCGKDSLHDLLANTRASRDAIDGAPGLALLAGPNSKRLNRGRLSPTSLSRREIGSHRDRGVIIGRRSAEYGATRTESRESLILQLSFRSI